LRVHVSGFRVQRLVSGDSEFRAQSQVFNFDVLWFIVEGLGFMKHGSVFGKKNVWGFGFWAQGPGFRVQCLGLRVEVEG